MSHRMRKGKGALKRKFYEDRQGSQKRRRLAKEQLLAKVAKEREEADEEEAMLEKLVFGDVSGVLENLPDEDCFTMDTDGDSGMEEGTSGNCSDSEERRQPAWHDDDDSVIRIEDAAKKQNREIVHAGPSSASYSSFIKQRYSNYHDTPKWARLDNKNKKSDDSSDSEDELLQHAGKFVTSHSSALPRNTLNIKQVTHLNMSTRREGVISSVLFHPSSTVALVAGLSGVASIVQVDGKDNAPLHSLKFNRFPILCARFSPDGNQFFAGSDSTVYHRYDLIEGRDQIERPHTPHRINNFRNFQISPDGQLMAIAGDYGDIFLLAHRTGDYVCTLRMNSEVTVLAFNADGSRLFAHGDTGEVYVWDTASRTCLMRFIDDGCISGSALAISPSGQYVATGSAQGIVNIYESSSLTTRTPSPCKIITNLTTSITSLDFNASSEILAMASNEKTNAVRLVHFPSMTVFSNYPGFMKEVPSPRAVDFSVNSGYFTVAADRYAYLYRLNHYGNY